MCWVPMGATTFPCHWQWTQFSPISHNQDHLGISSFIRLKWRSDIMAIINWAGPGIDDVSQATGLDYIVWMDCRVTVFMVGSRRSYILVKYPWYHKPAVLERNSHRSIRKGDSLSRAPWCQRLEMRYLELIWPLCSYCSPGGITVWKLRSQLK